jgi:16S rRNA (guanine527-N7)-methyltransferase
VERFGLAPDATAAIGRLLDLVERDATAPTAVRERSAAVDLHVADSLSGLELPAVREARRIADLGAGAGFPGLVLAAALPGAHVALVESATRKCAWLERAIDAMGLANAEVVHARAETWAQGTGACEIVTARAVAALNVLAEYAAPLLAGGGRLVAWKGRRDPAEEADGDAAAHALGLVAEDVVRVRPFEAARDRHLYVYLKVGPTPNQYPRRPGMAAKRPIRAST